MALIEALLVAVSVLAILAGVSVLVGSTKTSKSSGVWFFLATFGAAIWSVSIAWFLLLDVGAMELAKVLVVGIIAGVTVCDVSLLGYCGWQQRGGKVAMAIFGAIGLVMVCLLAMKPELFYSEISLNYECNKIEVVKGWYYAALIGFYTLLTLTFSSFLSKKIKKEPNKNRKLGLKVFYVGLSIGGILALIFDLVLLSSQPTLIWIGPMATFFSIFSFYYSTVKYRSISLTSRGMKVMSYSILCATGVILYIVVFYAVFAALFHQQNPSMAVILLNLIMLAILILLMPAINEVSGIMLGMVNTSKVQFDYVVKKLAKINGTCVNYKELAGFLADNLHYEYVAIIVGGRIYSSGNTKFTADDIVQIEHMKNTGSGIRLTPDRSIVKMLDNYEVSNVFDLINKDGESFGKVIFGKKMTKLEVDREDRIQYETIINYSAMVIENGSSKS